MSTSVEKRTECRICKSKKLEKFLSLGKTPPANAFIPKKEFKWEKFFPLEVAWCRTCNLVQLLHVVDKDVLFSHYVYFYSAMPAATNHFGGYTKDLMARFVKDPKRDLIFELGSNDGLLLKSFQEHGCKRVLGVDPAKNIAAYANQQGVSTIADFFSESLAKNIAAKHGKAAVMIGNNVVAHIDDLHDMIRGIDALLDPKGVFVFEAPYLLDMFENLAYDSIYHEHLSYLSVRPLIYFLKKNNMEIFDVQLTHRQGNSIRVFTGRKGAHAVLPSVKALTEKEKKLGLHTIAAYRKLAKRIQASKQSLRKILLSLKKKKFSIAAYGAPARGNTLLNYCRLGTNILDFATEELPLKIGLFSPGMHLPVKNITDARKNPPDLYVMLAWNYEQQIIEKESGFLANGGKFIIPIGDKIRIIR